MTSFRGRAGTIAAAFVLIIVLFASQALASASAPSGGMAATGRVIGRAGFAYLGGLRTFAAAILWNRIDPQFHTYYEGVPVSDQKFMIPTLRMVIALDPQFSQAYYIGSYLVGKQVGPAAGIDLAREGVRNCPKAGIVYSNLVQLLFVQDKAANRAEILRTIEFGIRPGLVWIDDEQEYEGIATMSEALKSLGKVEEADALRRRLDAMRTTGVSVGDHDHDDDGKEDH